MCVWNVGSSRRVHDIIPDFVGLNVRLVSTFRTQVVEHLQVLFNVNCPLLSDWFGGSARFFNPPAEPHVAVATGHIIVAMRCSPSPIPTLDRD